MSDTESVYADFRVACERSAAAARDFLRVWREMQPLLSRVERAMYDDRP